MAQDPPDTDIRQPSRPLQGKAGGLAVINPPSVDAGQAAPRPEAEAEVPPSVAGALGTSEQTTNIINDQDFMSDLKRLRELRSFFLQEAVIVERNSTAFRFGRLNLLRSPLPLEQHARTFRAPTELEYNQVESHWQTLLGLLTPALRRRFILGAIPQYLAWFPIILAVIALGSLYLAISKYGQASAVATATVPAAAQQSQSPGVAGALAAAHYGIGVAVLPYYLLWLMSLGAIGAIAFIGMNALSLQEDVTFDLTNSRLITMRITLGSLFGLVLTLPFGFDGFLVFCRSINAGTGTGKVANPNWTVQAILLLLPFVLGFSTSLVILILNRAVEAVQGFFGRAQSSANQSQALAAPSTGVSPPSTQAAAPVKT